MLIRISRQDWLSDAAVVERTSGFLQRTLNRNVGLRQIKNSALGNILLRDADSIAL